MTTLISVYFYPTILFVASEHSFTYNMSMNSAANNSSPEFPRAILHIDGDSFFASCEVACRPWLRGKPVVTGSERGIASSMTYEAKARGISRGMRISDMRKVCPDLILLESDYDAYKIYSRRMCNIVRRYTSIVEEYSIDECFADITGMDEKFKMTYEDLVMKIREDLHSSLGITFSFGLSVNKSLAKLASKWQKPRGVTIIPKNRIDEFTSTTQIGKVWGIGASTTLTMKRKGINTAFELAQKDRFWMKENFDRPVMEIYEELRGAFVMNLSQGGHHDYSSIQKTGTFRPSSRDRAVVFAHLSRNIESAARRLRTLGLYTGRVSFFLKTQEFQYISAEIKLPQSTSTPQHVLEFVRARFECIFKPGILYRATGVTFGDLRNATVRSFDLFGYSAGHMRSEKIYETVDRMEAKYGRNTLFLGSSWSALKGEAREVCVHKFGLIYLGETN